jgi:hypothetical protein
MDSANSKKKWYKKREALVFNYKGKGIKERREECEKGAFA